MGFLQLALLLLAALATATATNSSLDITIPATVEVKGEDSYVCITRALPDKPLKLVGVEPLAQQEVVHHILLFGCDEPFAKPKHGEQAVWECKSQPTCGGRQEAILYGWGRNAPKLELPHGVGFSIGKGSAVKWIVMQLHYLKEKPAGDTSGVKLRVQDTPVPFSAGMLSYASWFTIPPRKKQHYVLNHCCYRGFQPLHTFAVRVHTHTMGRQVFMTRSPPAHAAAGGEVIALGDPLLPQGFSPVAAKTLWPGERFTVGCEFDSADKTAPVSAGADHTHEMCNLYLMVYSGLPHIEMCSDGAGLVDEGSPGNVPRAAALLPDPFPLWKPPAPSQTLDKGVVGNTASVAVAPDGSVWVLTRGGRVWRDTSFTPDNRLTDKEPIPSNVVLQLHQDTGKILRQWGAGTFYMPHMISVDRNGSVWVTDVGRHQALQFTPGGKLLRSVGREMTPGHDKDTLCKPTQVASLNDGSFIVSDGYCNSRAVRYNPDGTYHSQYELPSSQAAAAGQAGGGMGVSHSVVVDECDGHVVIADRENQAVHTFDLVTHKLIGTKSLAAHGKVWALLKGPYGRTLALCWQQGKDAAIVDLADPGSLAWALPNSSEGWPHDFALGAAALPLTGAGDRLLAFYVAPLCEACGALQKFVMVPKGFDAAAAADSAAQPVQQKQLAPGQRPPLAHLGGHGHAAKAATAAAAATEEQPQQPAVASAAPPAETEADSSSDHASLQALQTQLAELQRKVAKAAAAVSSSGADDDGSSEASLEAVRGGGSSTPGGEARGGPQSWGSYVATVSLSVGLGVLVGGVALHVLQKRVLTGGGKRPPTQPGSGGVRYSPARALRAGEDEEADGAAAAAAASDTRRLLALNGNGHISSSTLQR